ncbi:uncharacterized protein M421DRAFT_352304 [Didymella exigua CBS 183.55]|uniref:Uncharacterized protein n=1 Tax=Didymella exigua CBS 183.55 TaxID=1150837 RepID=A0A6A5R618_9PLEO|nr:uncharacterized protein M421DRAFT_352304 [Didymella exigua CBS 183.55]KAF1922628.1 hypothetical protein M421DRAFT_352304 [Didymella exigua CBS 183.55]
MSRLPSLLLRQDWIASASYRPGRWLVRIHDECPDRRCCTHRNQYRIILQSFTPRILSHVVVISIASIMSERWQVFRLFLCL